MTGLERVRDVLKYLGWDEGSIDAHLKEDAALSEYVAKLEWRLAELLAQSCAWSCVGVPFEQRGEGHKRTCKP